ncbi:unnamed protein product [Adineta ricciae]|uniref:Peptide hydrolase n=1 Tax=Adineta ricciae TaxID=249248 RepID=A0A814PP76_ADIRI|nr:unnamed protein product [Adineta ricciae]
MQTSKAITILISVLGILASVVIFTLTALALTKINKKVDEIRIYTQKSIINFQGRQISTDSHLSSSIYIDEVMSHLNEFQRIATMSNGTRAVNTLGFNRTLDYITNYLTANTNFKISRTSFTVVPKRLARPPILITTINGTSSNHSYSSSQLAGDFYHIEYTASARFAAPLELTVIPNLGCTDNDWRRANPPATGRVVLVKRGECTFLEKGALASKYRVAALLLYNDGTSADRRAPVFVTLGENNTLPALFLSFQLGQKLADAVQHRSNNVRVFININRTHEQPFPSDNICADTPTGDPTQTIIIGSHSDSVPGGPGINDNGSGSAANLALAVALARLFRTPSYHKFRYRVRFCWWGAEEIGLLGSDHHVKQAKNSSIIGERLSDYLVNLNYDMLASPNYIFGIYDGRTAKNDTPAQALPGSNKITSLFRDWFVEQHLPWDYTDFSGRSDYGPFLAEGIVAGGLFSGASGVKSVEQRNRYDAILGQGLGGIPDITEDPCYHKACDSIENINIFAYEKMVQAAAYALENLGRKEDLRSWLYPTLEIRDLGNRNRSQLVQ